MPWRVLRRNTGLRLLPLSTVNVAFEEFRGRSDDEAPLAAEVARRFRHRVILSVWYARQEFEADLPRIFAAMDQPTIDGINTWFVSKAARERGLKVALSGLGGDELFGGYPSFRDLPRWVTALSYPGRLPGLGPPSVTSIGDCASHATHEPQSSRPARIWRQLSGSLSVAARAVHALGASWLLGEELAQEGLARLDPLGHIAGALSPDPGHPFARVAALEASLYLRNQLLRDTDWASMAHSLEVRVPLVDRMLLETLAPLLVAPDRAPGKTWLAQAPRLGLPKEIIHRPKTGFLTPINEWLVRSRTLREAASRPNLPVQTHWSRRWALAVLSQFVPDGTNMVAAA